MVSDENHEFLRRYCTLGNLGEFEISELLTARRMTSPFGCRLQTMWCPRSRKRGATRVAAADSSPDGPGAASVAAWALALPHGLETGERRQPGLFPQDRGSYLDPEVELRAYSLGLL
ncbi:hypothetical protein EVAR_34162_1 [Eumeta japonica]|uniref:Uncharacterized protein n=1 Tax=Eumeta variegata TaxID=151549 RepID=A0A4C1WKK9_EUMVA|nr:hypothetical protein EVAR_34162_1 [Eumeta japonica]